MLVGFVQPFDLWLAYGMKQGWVSSPVCAMHDAIPAREWEHMEVEAGLDPCLMVLRLWEDGLPNDEDEIHEPSPRIGEVDHEDS
jgi:hypothetical protein